MNRRLDLFDHLRRDALQNQTRRHFLQKCSGGLAALWMAEASSLLADDAKTRNGGKEGESAKPRVPLSHPAKAKRVIFLHMAGAPSQFEMFEHKPDLVKYDGQDAPREYVEGERFAFISGTPRVLGPRHPFHQAGESGQWISNLLPNFEKKIDDVCLIRSMQTDQFNHAPAQLLLLTGNQNGGYPAIGSWLTWGLGTENANLPGFIVLISGGRTPSAGKSGWSSGFLSGEYQGVQCRSSGDPVLFLANPEGVSADLRRKALEAIDKINRRAYEELGDEETLARLSQYELAFRMQTSASEAFDLKDEPAEMLALYGARPGETSFANNCLLARRLAERGVRFIQLFDWGWDHHGESKDRSVSRGMTLKCGEVDRPLAALLEDLKQRGLLDDTLVVWCSEFGRTPMQENRGGNQNKFPGRDHHKDAFTIWLAGAGVKKGISHGATDSIGFRVAENPVHVRDLQATILHLLGYDHAKLTFRYQGLDQRLTGVTRESRVVREVLS